MTKQKLQNLLGLAQKAGKVVSGEIAIEKSIKYGQAKLMILAEDASVASKKNYLYLADIYKLPYYEKLTKQELGTSIGKHDRSAIIVLDDGFAQAVLKILNDI